MYLIENEYKRELAEMQKSLIVKDSALAEKDKILTTMQKTYQKSLIVKDKALVIKDKALTAERKAHQKALAELAELKRKFGVN